MHAVSTEKKVRNGDPEKRAAILVAARDLFVSQGVDRVSMDAVAAEAAVSKRTVYDYFGDKRRLFLSILSAASESMLATSRRALDEHLPLDAQITTVPQLEEALTALAIDLGKSIVGSADYAAAFALVAQRRLQIPTTEDDLATEAASQGLAERIAHFVDVGLLEADDPRLAVDHFNALTILLAYERHPVPAVADPEKVRQIMGDGVHAFIRAYAKR